MASQGQGSRHHQGASAGTLGLCGLLLAGLCAAASAGNVPGVENVRFRNYSVTEGLPQASVIDMAQGSEGFLWFATQKGLARFDGYEFRVYQHNPDNPSSLASDHIKALVAGENGDLWIGTQSGGLDHFLPNGERFVHYRAREDDPSGLASDSVYALASGRDGRLWIATLGAKLQWIDPGDRQVHDAPLGKHEALSNVRALLPLGDGSLLVGTAQGLWKVDSKGQHMRLWGKTQSSQRCNVYDVEMDAKGDVWVATDQDGILQFDSNGKLKRRYRHREIEPGSLPDDEVRALHFDPMGNLWVAGNSKGLARLASGSNNFEHFVHDPTDPQSLVANRLWSLAGTRDGILLVGSWANGFGIHDPRTEMFTQILSIPGNPRTLPAPPALEAYGEEDGSIWIGVHEGGGLVHFDFERGLFKRYTHDPDDADSLSSNVVTVVIRGPDGALWVGTGGGGLDRMLPDGSGFQHIRHDPADPKSLASNDLRYVYFDSKGTMWVATKDGGLDELCASCAGFLHHQPGGNGSAIGDINVSRVLESADGSIWVGTRSNGLYRRAVGSKAFDHIAAGEVSGLSSNSITAMHEDHNGVLWVGTQGGGLNYADLAKPLHFAYIDKRGGLNSDAIGEILEDDDGNIWVSTIKGISRIDPATMDVRNFGASDGASALGYWVNSGSRLADGRLAFGGLNGVTVVQPETLQPLPVARPMITALVMAGHRFSLGAEPPNGVRWQGDTLLLSHEQSDIGAEFASLDYADPQSTRYSYMLQGYDNDWIEAPSNRRLAQYTNLPPGNYRLLVRARHDAGAWSEHPVSLAFEMQPAPWASPLAYAGYTGILLLLIGGVGWRVRADIARKRHAQAALQLSAERLKMALWGSGSEMWDVDLRDGSLHHENRLSHIAANNEASEDSLVGYSKFLHDDDRAEFEGALAEHLSGRSKSFEASYRTLDRDHRWVWLLSRGRVVDRDESGKPVRMSGTSSDINALKQAEASLRHLNETLELHVEQRTAALRDANNELRNTLQRLTQTQQQLLEAEKLASLGSLVAGVAHEINTPLGVGVTAASHLRDEAVRLAAIVAKGEISDADLRRFSEHIMEGAEIILRNLKRADVLVKSFKQVAVEQSSDDVRSVNLAQCIGDIVTTLGPSLRQGAHLVDVDCPQDLELRTSPGALYQIITNLIVNSVIHGFAPDKPGRIHIAVAEHDGEVHLDYRDDGRGMSEEVRARVFDPFFTTRRGQGGSGLGMHIVYNLVSQALKGKIALNTSPGEGVHIEIHFSGLGTSAVETFEAKR